MLVISLCSLGTYLCYPHRVGCWVPQLCVPCTRRGLSAGAQLVVETSHCIAINFNSRNVTTTTFLPCPCAPCQQLVARFPAGRFRFFLILPVLTLNWVLPLMFDQSTEENVPRSVLLLALGWIGSFKVRPEQQISAASDCWNPPLPAPRRGHTYTDLLGVQDR